MEIRKKVKIIVKVCGYHFYRWRHNKRILMAFLLAFILCFLLTEKVNDFTLTQGTTLQIFEPFIWVFGDGISILLVALIVILVFADMPFLDGAEPYYLIRINVVCWVLGQLLYLILATFIYSVFILISTMLLCGKNAFIGNLWSPTAALLGYSSYAEQLNIPASLKTFQMSLPYSCLITIFFLVLLYILLSVMLMFYITIKKGQIIGIAACFGFHLFGLLLNPDWLSITFNIPAKAKYIANIICGWLSPLRQATYQKHNFGYDMLPSLKNTYIIYGILILVLLLGTIRAMKNYHFNFLGTQEE